MVSKKQLASLAMLGLTMAPSMATSVQVLADENVKVEIKSTDSNDSKTQIKNLEKDIKALKADKKQLEDEANATDKEIKKLTNQINEYSAQIKKQAQSAQTSNSTDVVGAVANSGSLSEAMQTVMAMTKLTDANVQTVEDFEQKKADLDTKQKENQKKRDDLSKKQVVLETKQAKLEELKAKQEEEEKRAAAEEAARIAKEKADAASAEQAARAQSDLDAAISNVSVKSAASATAQDVQASSAEITPNYSANTGSYPVGQCTWGAKALAPWAGNYWGNGGDWARSAAAAGFETGSTPRVGAIASWNDGGYGHVAVVYAVQSATSIRVKESNYNGLQYIADHRGWFNPTATSSGQVTYIYPKA